MDSHPAIKTKLRQPRRYGNSLTMHERDGLHKAVKTMPLDQAAAKYNVVLGTAYKFLRMQLPD